MRVISGECDVIKVLASDMLNLEISRYLFYKGRVINWSNPAMLSLYNAMLVSSKHLNTDMFIKYSLPLTSENIESQYDRAPLYPVYQEGYDGASIGVFNEVSINSDNIRTYKVNIPLLYNLHKFIKKLVNELRSYPVFKATLFNSKTGVIYNEIITNSTIVNNYTSNYDKISLRSFRIINVNNSKLNKTLQDIDNDNELTQLLPDNPHKGRVARRKWIFGTKFDSDDFNDVIVYIDYLNLYKGVHFAEDKRAIYGNIKIWECNVECLVPSLYINRFVTLLELLDNADVKEGVVEPRAIFHNRYTKCCRCPIYINKELEIGVLDIVNDITLCIGCFHYDCQQVNGQRNVFHTDFSNFRLFYLGVKFDNNLDQSLQLKILKTMLNPNNDDPVEYSKNKGNIAKIKDVGSNKYTVIIFDNAEDLYEMDISDNTRLVYAIKHETNGIHDDSKFDCNYQKL